MTIFLTRPSPPIRTQSPLTFQAEHCEAVPWRGCALRRAACSARHSCLPAHLPSAHCQSSGQPASACDYRKPLPNPQLSGWAADTSLSLRRCFTPQNQPGSSWKVRGTGGKQCGSQSPRENNARASPLVCWSQFPLQQMQQLMWSTRQNRNHWILFNCLLLIMAILGLHYSFAYPHSNFFTYIRQPVHWSIVSTKP